MKRGDIWQAMADHRAMVGVSIVLMESECLCLYDEVSKHESSLLHRKQVILIEILSAGFGMFVPNYSPSNCELCPWSKTPRPSPR